MEPEQATAALHAWGKLSHSKAPKAAGSGAKPNGNGPTPNGKLSAGDVELILSGLKRLQKVAVHP